MSGNRSGSWGGADIQMSTVATDVPVVDLDPGPSSTRGASIGTSSPLEGLKGGLCSLDPHFVSSGGLRGIKDQVADLAPCRRLVLAPYDAHALLRQMAQDFMKQGNGLEQEHAGGGRERSQT